MQKSELYQREVVADEDEVERSSTKFESANDRDVGRWKVRSTWNQPELVISNPH